ncbi:MAG: c-type cytochrome biogenesis protein CcmI [Gammaproteobacteria bacterium]|nr:c-type cytochrome biogenesis protein CcmI [Gammaproteobacteria bacterium]
MILFMLCALALAGAAMAIIWPALRGRRPLNRDQLARQNIQAARQRLEELEQCGDEDHAARAQSRGEIERALLDDLAADPESGAAQNAGPPKAPGKAATALIGGSIPAAAVAIYLVLGNVGALTPPDPVPAAPDAPPMTEVMRQLEQALVDDPDNPGHWALAGRAYMAVRRFDQAEHAYRTLHRLVGDDPEVLVAWADAAVMANNGVFSKPALARIEQALKLSPENKNALWLAALGAEAGADYRRALSHLQRLLPLVEEETQERVEVISLIAKMRRLEAPAGGDSPAVEAEASKAVPVALSVEVKIDPALAAQVDAGDGADRVVYVFATAPQAGGPPLAVSRHRASQWPIAVVLDDSMAMMPGLTLSDFQRVAVMARLSRSGDPAASPGDFQSAAVVVRSDRRAKLQLVIDRVVGAAGDRDATAER